MRYFALATDYDGTIAKDGEIAKTTVLALRRLRASGRRAILVTGRDIDDLRRICSCLELFDRVVAENGGLIFDPATGEMQRLSLPIPNEFVQELKRRGVADVVVSSTIVATVKPYETIAMEVIRDLGLELKIVFNKDAVMITSPGVTKATGLAKALSELELSAHNVVGVGDAENDHDLLKACECSVAVANALPMIKKVADFVTSAESTEGVAELILNLISDDLRTCEAATERHRIFLGQAAQTTDSTDFGIAPYGTVALISGPSRSGKSTITRTILEQLSEKGYQFCVIDPEGDYANFPHAAVMGGPNEAPSIDTALHLITQGQSVILDLLQVPLRERPEFCATTVTRLQELRSRSGRPHWLVLEEAHHLFPPDWEPPAALIPAYLETALLVTVHPKQVSAAILKDMNLVLAVGSDCVETLQEFATVVKRHSTPAERQELKLGQALVWQLDSNNQFVIQVKPSSTSQRRHHRKYAEGMLRPEKSFYFRGPDGRLRLRAHNLIQFLELADGVDDATWTYHLRRREYSQWIAKVIHDEKLADEIAGIESDTKFTPEKSRTLVRAAVESQYTLPEE